MDYKKYIRTLEGMIIQNRTLKCFKEYKVYLIDHELINI